MDGSVDPGPAASDPPDSLDPWSPCAAPKGVDAEHPTREGR